MGNRLSKIYTRTGDDGSTGLGNGNRVSKDSARVEAYGCVDELNSVLGVLRAHELPEDIDRELEQIQHELFELGGELCMPGYQGIKDGAVARLELALDQLNEGLPPLKEFILPGGDHSAACCHLARTVCRRTERRVITLAGSEQVNEIALHYLNRLSDLLFVMGTPAAILRSGRSRNIQVFGSKFVEQAPFHETAGTVLA